MSTRASKKSALKGLLQAKSKKLSTETTTLTRVQDESYKVSFFLTS